MRHLVLWVLTLACGLVQAAAGDALNNWGVTYNPKCSVVVKVPKRTFKAMPTNIDVLSIDGAQFPSEGIKAVLKYILTNTTERETLATRINDHLLLSNKIVILKDGAHGRLSVDPQNGVLLFELGQGDEPKVPPTNGISNSLKFDSFKQTVRDLASKLHINDNEIARKPNGDFDIVVSDNERFPHHQKEPILYKRTVTFTRTANGFKMLPGHAGFFQIELGRFVNGQWSRIYVYWPRLKAVGSCRSYQSDAAIKEAIQSAKCLWDHNNEIALEDVKGITVTDCRVVYSTSKDGLSLPVTCLDCDMKTDRGSEYGVLFLPLEKNR